MFLFFSDVLPTLVIKYSLLGGAKFQQFNRYLEQNVYDAAWPEQN